MTIKAYHYSNKPFESFDLSKCDGFWFTDIKPYDEEMINEIGASSMDYVAVCELSFEDPLIGGENYDVEAQLVDTDYDALENIYEAFTDYALIDASKIKVLEWKEI